MEEEKFYALHFLNIQIPLNATVLKEAIKEAKEESEWILQEMDVKDEALFELKEHRIGEPSKLISKHKAIAGKLVVA